MTGEPVTAQMEKITDTISAEIEDAVEDSEELVAEQTMERLKATSPRRSFKMKGRPSGKYARGWRAKWEDGGWVVYNATDWQLTHLLNNGHDVVNRYGKTGARVNGDDHITNAEKYAIAEFPRQVLARISRGLK